jgi:uncharacterized glyoxalase superfamily protein PhnB
MAKPKSTVSTEIIPYIFYRDVPAALDWLTRAFGFAETMRTATPNGGTHGEMTLDGQRIMMGQGSKGRCSLRSSLRAQAAKVEVSLQMREKPEQLLKWLSSGIHRRRPYKRRHNPYRLS